MYTLYTWIGTDTLSKQLLIYEGFSVGTRQGVWGIQEFTLQ
jgi:hypothetical protein